jgi:hypothetical protein
VEAAINALDAEVEPVLTVIDPACIARRLAAVACYKSQFTSFTQYWQNTDEMYAMMRQDIERIGGEREWRLVRAHNSD